MHLRVETELEEDGRWIAEIPQLPSVLAYGSTEEKPQREPKSWRCASS
jgi:predicted RNase H-like HicB family nuclease